MIEDKLSGKASEILVLSYWNLNQPSSGGARRIHALLEALGSRVYLVQPTPAHPLYRGSSLRCDFGRKKRFGINGGLFNFFWPPTRRQVRRILRERGPALVVVTSIWAYFPLRGLRRLPPVVLDAHDVLGHALAERFGDRHLFTRLVRVAERYVVRRVDHVFACSELNREEFIRSYACSPAKVSVVPNGVDAELWRVPAATAGCDPAHLAPLAGRTTLFFMGKLDYQPNEQAVSFLLEKLMPTLEQKAPGRFALLICGGPKPNIKAPPHVVFTGRVPDVVPYIQCATICLAPISTGSGTRLKILEYMAAGKPVISTAKGAEGICGNPGEHLELAEMAWFADAVIKLAGDPKKAAQLGDAAKSLVENHYDWRVIGRGWPSVIVRLAGG